MITSNILQGVKPLAKTLAQRGISLESDDATPLGTMVNATDLIVDDSGEVDTVATANINTTSTNPLPIAHNLALDTLVEEAKKRIAGQLMVARNEVAPLQEAIYNKAVAILEAPEDYADSAQFEIIEYTLPDVVRNDSFTTLIKEFETAFIEPVGNAFNLPLITAAEIVERCKTGFRGLDSDVELWLASKGDDFINSVWIDFFSSTLDSDSRLAVDKLTGEVDKCLAVFLLTRNLLENVIADSNMDATTYKSKLSTLRNLAGFTLCKIINQYNNYLQNNVIVLVVSGTKVKVLKETYVKWLEEGNQVETLFGMVLTNKDSINVTSTSTKLTESRDKYLQSWNDFISVRKAIRKENRMQEVRNAILQAFNEEISPNNGVYKVENPHKAYSDFKSLLRKVHDSKFENLNDVILHLITDVLYPNSKVYFILSRMDYHVRSKSASTPREAATLATIELVTDWVCEQINLN